ncbi:MAG: hypothetical protein HGA31_06320 [Candidatus Moranbacteria bacterium]|nr:hypothetical protein [Candidatus Moranbacteria bacterium]
MKKLALFLLVMLWGFHVAFAADGNPPVPALKAPVNDYANIIPDSTEAALNRSLAEYSEKTSNQIAILTTDDFGGLDVEEYSILVATTWALGQKGVDNGILVTINPVARKVRIEVGYGFEGIVTDVRSGEIIDSVKPLLKEGRYDLGVVEIVRRLRADMGGDIAYAELKARRDAQTAKDVERFKAFVVDALIAIIVIACIVGVVLVVRMFWKMATLRRQIAEETDRLIASFSAEEASFHRQRENAKSHVTPDFLSEIDGRMKRIKDNFEHDVNILAHSGPNTFGDLRGEVTSAIYAVSALMRVLRGARETVSGVGSKINEAENQIGLAESAVMRSGVSARRRDQVAQERQRYESIRSSISRSPSPQVFDYLSATVILGQIIDTVRSIREEAIEESTPRPTYVPTPRQSSFSPRQGNYRSSSSNSKPSSGHTSPSRPSRGDDDSPRRNVSVPDTGYSSPSVSIDTYSGGGGGFGGGGASGDF